MQKAGAQFHAFRAAHGRVVALDDCRRLRRVAQRFDDERQPLRERLHDETIAITIDDHAGQTVAFAPDEPAEVGIHAALFPILNGLCDAAFEKIEVEILALPRETARDDLRFGIEDRAAERSVAKIFQ